MAVANRSMSSVRRKYLYFCKPDEFLYLAVTIKENRHKEEYLGNEVRCKNCLCPHVCSLALDYGQ